MKKLCKRSFSWVLAFVLAVSMVPIGAAFAGEGEIDALNTKETALSYKIGDAVGGALNFSELGGGFAADGDPAHFYKFTMPSSGAIHILVITLDEDLELGNPKDFNWKISPDGTTKGYKDGTSFYKKAGASFKSVKTAKVNLKAGTHYLEINTKLSTPIVYSFGIYLEPNKVSIKSASAGKKSMTVKWKKSSTKVSKYEVQYREKGKKSWTTKRVSGSKTSYKATKLKSGSLYQVRVRPVINYGEDFDLPGKWSSVKTTSKRVR